jgi:hypothetical protein
MERISRRPVSWTPCSITSAFDHPAAVADLLDLGIEEHVGVAELQRPRPERADMLIERHADPACWMTPSSACSERRRGSRKLGK